MRPRRPALKEEREHEKADALVRLYHHQHLLARVQHHFGLDDAGAAALPGGALCAGGTKELVPGDDARRRPGGGDADPTPGWTAQRPEYQSPGAAPPVYH